MPLGTMQHSGPDLTNLILLEELERKGRVNLFRKYLQHKPCLVKSKLVKESSLGLAWKANLTRNVDKLSILTAYVFLFPETNRSQLCGQNFDFYGAKQ